MAVHKDHWTQDDIRALVGRRFRDRKGMTRCVIRVVGNNIYWARPGCNMRRVPIRWPYFREWLSTAEELAPAESKSEAKP